MTSHRSEKPPFEDRLATFVCSVRDHDTPAAHAAELRPQDQEFGFDLDGVRMSRCLRCDVLVAGRPPDPESATWPVLPPLEELHIPRRGRTLRDAFFTRLIAIDRGVHAVLFTLLFLALMTLEIKLGPLQAQARSLRSSLTGAVTESGRNPSRDFLVRLLDRVLRLHRQGLPILTMTAAAYAVVEGVEAVGLWRERRWAEYLTVVATAGFLPFEIDELVKRVTVLRIGALVVNVAVLVYLVWSKRLFGFRRHDGPPADAPPTLPPPPWKQDLDKSLSQSAK